MNIKNGIGFIVCLIASFTIYSADNMGEQQALLQAFKESSYYPILKTSSEEEDEKKEKKDMYIEPEKESSDYRDSSGESTKGTGGFYHDPSKLIQRLHKYAKAVPIALAYIMQESQSHDAYLQFLYRHFSAQEEKISKIMIILDNIECRLAILDEKVREKR